MLQYLSQMDRIVLLLQHGERPEDASSFYRNLKKQPFHVES